MALGIRLQQKQSQSLVMTPQLAQSIKLLQLNHQELLEFVQAEIEKNPLLEMEPENSTLGKERRKDRNTAEPGNADASHQSQSVAGPEISAEMGTDAENNEGTLDTSFENVYDSDNSSQQVPGNSFSETATPSSGSSRESTEAFDQFATVGEQKSLAQYLEEQIGVTFHGKDERAIATYFAHNLDEDGYFREDLREVASAHHSKLQTVRDVLTRFQMLEPAGIGARNLGECLQIQLAERDRYDPAMAKLVENLELLAKREYAKLRKLCGVSKEDFSDMLAELRALDPRPAARHAAVLSEPVIADVFVNQKPDGNWSIELNPETLPKVLVNREYHAELERAIGAGDGKNFVTDCMNNANWLVKSLDQRAQTILKVSTEIVRLQDMFFAEGVEHLKPMNLKQVADAIKMHESTVSRVTSNKYLRCDRGIFELKFFFSSSIGNADEGEADYSSETVKHRIKQLVDAENPRKILSDDQIVKQLQETGIAIARRTVAKYREAMRIPSSVQRRRDKRSILG